jgi:hypothetical protein
MTLILHGNDDQIVHINYFEYGCPGQWLAGEAGRSLHLSDSIKYADLGLSKEMLSHATRP